MQKINSYCVCIFTALRKVYPYHFTFSTHAKGRWYNRKLIDVFTSEFRWKREEVVSISFFFIYHFQFELILFKKSSTFSFFMKVKFGTEE